MEEKNQEPGVSGKNNKGQSWINTKELDQQKDFAEEMHEIDKGYDAQGRGQNLFGRTDLSDQEGHEKSQLSQQVVVLALKRSPEVDISQVEVDVVGSKVILRGSVDDAARVRTLENIVNNIPGVSEVDNQLEPRAGERL